MMMTKLLCAAILAGLAMPALACSQLPAFSVFMGMNDTDRNGALSKKEFLRAKTDPNLILKFKLNSRTFRKLDRNRNGMLEQRDQDWYNWVEYKRAPCADWEEQMQKMMEREKSESNQNNAQLPAQ